MKDELKTKLLAALKITRPDIKKEYLYERCVTKYIDAMLIALGASIIAKYKNVAATEFLFSQTDIREAVGTIGKKQEYIYHLMQKDDSTSLIKILRNGFSKDGKSSLSVATLNPIYKDIIMEELLNLRFESTQKLLEDIENNSNMVVFVDPVTLTSFINKTTETYNTTQNGDAYKNKLLRNITAAKQLRSMIHLPDDDFALPYIKERWEKKPSGRIFGQGYSLQLMPKDVRHAALGECHKYDFKACAFAIMAGIAQSIDPDIKIGAVLDYIKNRQAIRTKIANQLNISESLIKEIFTALGFGAELKDNQHNAIRGALAKAARISQDSQERLSKEEYNNLGADEYQKLLSNQTFQYIYEDLQNINNTILRFYHDQELTIENDTYNPINPETGKKRTERHKLAWLYQHLEYEALKLFYSLVDNQEPLLTAHDCVYFKQKLSAEQVKSITYQLQQLFPYIRFEHEHVYPIVEDSVFHSRYDESNQFEADHQRHIAAETELAAIKLSERGSNWINTSIVTPSQSIADIDQIMLATLIQQEQPDYEYDADEHEVREWL